MLQIFHQPQLVLAHSAHLQLLKVRRKFTKIIITVLYTKRIKIGNSDMTSAVKRVAQNLEPVLLPTLKFSLLFPKHLISMHFYSLNGDFLSPLTPEAFCQKLQLWTFWRFSGQISAPFYSNLK